MKARLLNALLITLLPIICITAQIRTSESIEHDEIDRNYTLIVPSSYESLGAMPLVFNLHGYGSNNIEQEFYSAMNSIAEREGFILCLPQGLDNGLGASWNVGFGFESNADDVGFIGAIIDEISESYNVDAKRVYSCGMSNGGFMSYRLACELSDRITAVASVTGSMTPFQINRCTPDRAVPVMQIHGTADATVLYDGNPNINEPIDDVVQFWVDINGCSSAADTIALEDINMMDESTAERIIFSDCNDETAVELYKIENGGHTWPGAGIAIPSGATNQDFVASEEIWRFFEQFSLGTTSSAELLAADADDVIISPNPITNILRVEGTGNWDQVQLLSSTGQILRNQLANNTMNLADLPQGIYYLRLSADGHSIVKSIVKM